MLGADGAVEIGQRKRRPASLGLGLLLLIGCTIWIGIDVWKTAAPIDWMHYKPDWWLVREAKSVDAERAEAALKELNARIERDAISDARFAGLVSYALELQADESAMWLAGWGDVIQTAWVNGSLSSEQFLQYMQRAVDFQMIAESPTVRRWEFARVGVQWTRTRASGMEMPLDIEVGEMTLGGIKVEPDPVFEGIYRTVNAMGNPVVGTSFAVLAEPGEYELKITWVASLRGGIASTPLLKWDVPLAERITVLQPTEHAQELITDPQVTASFKDHIEMRAIGLRVPPEVIGGSARFSRVPGGRIVIVLTLRDSPIAGGFDFAAKDQPPFTGMYGTGRMGLEALRGSSYQAHLFVRLPVGTEPDRIGVLIRPSVNHIPGIGIARPGTERVWYGKPTEISDIPVSWYDTADDPAVPEDVRPILYRQPGVQKLIDTPQADATGPQTPAQP